jgi:hypothetical protein
MPSVLTPLYHVLETDVNLCRSLWFPSVGEPTVAATSTKRSADPIDVYGRSAPEAVTPAHAHIPSPAQGIQLRLTDILADERVTPDIKKWSARRSSAVIICVSCALWLGLAAVLRLALA